LVICVANFSIIPVCSNISHYFGQFLRLSGTERKASVYGFLLQQGCDGVGSPFLERPL